jgi:hypothetical protein
MLHKDFGFDIDLEKEAKPAGEVAEKTQQAEIDELNKSFKYAFHLSKSTLKAQEIRNRLAVLKVLKEIEPDREQKNPQAVVQESARLIVAHLKREEQRKIFRIADRKSTQDIKEKLEKEKLEQANKNSVAIDPVAGKVAKTAKQVIKKEALKKLDASIRIRREYDEKLSLKLNKKLNEQLDSELNKRLTRKLYELSKVSNSVGCSQNEIEKFRKAIAGNIYNEIRESCEDELREKYKEDVLIQIDKYHPDVSSATSLIYNIYPTDKSRITSNIDKVSLNKLPGAPISFANIEDMRRNPVLSSGLFKVAHTPKPVQSTGRRELLEVKGVHTAKKYDDQILSISGRLEQAIETSLNQDEARINDIDIEEKYSGQLDVISEESEQEEATLRLRLRR